MSKFRHPTIWRLSFWFPHSHDLLPYFSSDCMKCNYNLHSEPSEHIIPFQRVTVNIKVMERLKYESVRLNVLAAHKKGFAVGPTSWNWPVDELKVQGHVCERRITSEPRICSYRAAPVYFANVVLGRFHPSQAIHHLHSWTFITAFLLLASRPAWSKRAAS